MPPEGVVPPSQAVPSPPVVQPPGDKDNSLADAGDRAGADRLRWFVRWEIALVQPCGKWSFNRSSPKPRETRNR